MSYFQFNKVVILAVATIWLQGESAAQAAKMFLNGQTVSDRTAVDLVRLIGLDWSEFDSRISRLLTAGFNLGGPYDFITYLEEPSIHISGDQCALFVQRATGRLTGFVEAPGASKRLSPGIARAKTFALIDTFGYSSEGLVASQPWEELPEQLSPRRTERVQQFYKRRVAGTPYHYPGGFEVGFYAYDSTMFYFKPRKEFAIEPFTGPVRGLGDSYEALALHAGRHFEWNELRLVPNQTDYMRMATFWEGASERVKRLAGSNTAFLQTSYLVYDLGSVSPAGQAGKACIITVDAVTGEVLSSDLLSGGSGGAAQRQTALNVSKSVTVVGSKKQGRLVLVTGKKVAAGLSVTLAQGHYLVRARYDTKQRLLAFRLGGKALVGKPDAVLAASLKDVLSKKR